MPKKLSDILHELASHIGRPEIHDDIDALDNPPPKPGFHYVNPNDKAEDNGKEDSDNAAE